MVTKDRIKDQSGHYSKGWGGEAGHCDQWTHASATANCHIQRFVQSAVYHEGVPPPPPPCLGTALRKNRPLVPRSNSRTTFFFTTESGFSWFWWMQDSYPGVQDNISCVLYGLQYLEAHICFCTTSFIPCYVP